MQSSKPIIKELIPIMYQLSSTNIDNSAHSFYFCFFKQFVSGLIAKAVPVHIRIMNTDMIWSFLATDYTD